MVAGDRSSFSARNSKTMRGNTALLIGAPGPFPHHTPFPLYAGWNPFMAFIDHKPLTFAMAKLSEPWSVRQQRHLFSISVYTTDIQHVADNDNFVADCLFRVVTRSVHLGLDFAAMAADHTTDSEVQSYKTAPTGPHPFSVPTPCPAPSLLLGAAVTAETEFSKNLDKLFYVALLCVVYFVDITLGRNSGVGGQCGDPEWGLMETSTKSLHL